MLRRPIRRRAALGAFAAALAAPRLGSAQAGYPSRPIRLVVPFAPGGTTDILGRLVANHLATAWGAQIVVENRAGAGGNVGADAVAKAAPDGHTLLLGTVGTAVTNQFLYKAIPYDTARDFAPVALVGEVANVLAVHPDLPVHSVAELVALAKAQPGKLDYGTPGVGGTGHLAMELLKASVGIDLEHVAYKGSSLVVQDLLPGRIKVTIDNLPPYLAHIRAGAVRALAVTTAKRWFALPEVPTVAESGVPGYDAAPWWYVAAPGGTASEIVRRVGEEVVRGLGTADMVERIRAAGAAALQGGPEALARHIAAETVKWKRVIDAAGLKPE